MRNKNYFKKLKNSEKGAALIVTFFVMVIILGINLSISAILYSEIKIVRNIGSSVSAFYAAESGIEKVLYYNRKVLPVAEEDNVSARGLCYMCDNNNPNACVEEPTGNTGERSVYCNNCTVSPKDIALEGCNPDLCNNCEVAFETGLDRERRYKIIADITPFGGTDDLFFKIDSTGYYKDYVLRAIEVIFSELNEPTPPSML